MKSDDYIDPQEYPPICAECGRQPDPGMGQIGFTYCSDCGNWYCSTHAYKVGQCIYEEPEW